MATRGKILVTGATGYLGSAFFERSRHAEHYVLLDMLAPTEVTEEALRGAYALVHLAGQVPRSDTTALEYDALNRVPTLALAELCAKAGVRFLYASTGSMYGGTEGTRYRENEGILTEMHPYTKSKYEAEQGIQKVVGLKFTILRLGTIFGFSPKKNFQSPVHSFLEDARTKGVISIWRTAPEQVRPYTWIGDVIGAIDFCLDRDVFNRKTYNVVSENTTVSAVLKLVQARYPQTRIELVDHERMNKLSYAMNDSAIRVEGFMPKGSVAAGIAEIDSLMRSPMRGVVLAGGRGTRLAPLTLTMNKHLLPVYDKPLIMWPVLTLVRMGVDSITIVSNPEDQVHYQKIFGDGSVYGVSMTYAVQQESNGVAGALLAAEQSGCNEGLAVILGDNIFFDAADVNQAMKRYCDTKGTSAMVFLKDVSDPERFGVAQVEGGRVVSLEEKPAQPASSLAVTGLYLYDHTVFDIIRGLKPSARGELEITDVNKAYLEQHKLFYHVLSGEWIDAGTHESLLQANIMAAGMEYNAERKLKILFGINKLAVGGAEHLVLHQLRNINTAHFEGHLVTLLPSTTPNLDHEAEFLGSRWKKFSFFGFFDVLSWIRLYRYVRREKFDVVVANLFFTSIILRVVARLAGVPVILSAELNAYAKRNPRWLPLERMLARCTDRFIASSRDVVATTTRELGVSEEKVTLSHNAIDLAVSKTAASPEARVRTRTKFGVAPDDFIIVTAGRLVEQKGQQYLIEAFAELVKKFPATPLKLYIFGEGALRESLGKRAKDLGIETLVVFAGIAPVPEIVALADVFVLPSLWEGLSLMLLEAMAAQNPIVATNVSGSRELIVDGENGYLVPPRNAAVLAERIGELIVDARLRARFARASTKEVQKFSIENNLNNLYTIIRTSRKAKKFS